MSRLIGQRAVLDRLLAAVAAVPPGVKISIPQLRDHLVSQADVLAGLEMLVAEGALDRATLRPPPATSPEAREQGDRPVLVTGGSQGGEPALTAVPTGVALAAALDVLIARFELSKCQVGVRLLGSTNGVERLRRGKPQRKTVDKVRAFLANPPVDELRRMRAPAGDRRFATNKPARAAASSEKAAPPPPCVTGAELAAELDRAIAQHGLSKTKVSVRLFAMKGGIESLRKRDRVRPATVDKVRAFIGAPPIEECKLVSPARSSLARAAVRESVPTLPRAPAPARAISAEAQAGHQKAAAVRRSVTKAAERLLDGDESVKTTGGKINSAVRGAMNAIIEKREREERQANPVEQAKLALQRKGRVVYSASVSGGRKDRFIVSGQHRELTPAELIELAERVTGMTFRRAVEPVEAAAGGQA